MIDHAHLSVADFDRHLGPGVKPHLQDILIVQEVGSSNDFLLAIDPPENNKALICMAEHQSAGRGTRGREWHSQLGASFVYSIAWNFSEAPQNISALTLAIGVVAQQTLENFGYSDVELKWPNDLLIDHKKLGGILVEVKQHNNSCHVVCGIGINLLSTMDSEDIDQAFTALDQSKNSQPPICRNNLAAKLSGDLIKLFMDYPETGFKPWREAWESLHALQNKSVRLEQAGDVIQGIALGVDDTGALQIQTDDAVRSVLSAENLVENNSQTNLYIDIGNTSMHWRVSNEKEIASPSVSIKHNKDWRKTLRMQQTTLGELKPDNIYIASVAGRQAQDACVRWFQQKFLKTPIFVQSQSESGDLRNAYDTSTQLGVDRWLGIIAGFQYIQTNQHDAALVVDAGTAMTIDAVLTDGTHLGGNIIAGLTTQQVNLLARTAEISDSEGETGVWGTNTASAVANGAYFALIGAILLAYEQLQSELPDDAKIHLMLTGGDAENLERYFAGHKNIDFSVHTNLVLDGLESYVAELNV
ncbi:MAG: biotin--[acetyl-CoA-carboxylase] ligase [Gammaproteobacteria bacterium]|nr:biotin--[acetyl-CoA-carboxylase] ligase [Gammaproteobacteria bacterium]